MHNALDTATKGIQIDEIIIQARPSVVFRSCPDAKVGDSALLPGRLPVLNICCLGFVVELNGLGHMTSIRNQATPRPSSSVALNIEVDSTRMGRMF